MERSTIHYLKQKGWNNSQIAKAVGCHRDTVRRIMREPVDHEPAPRQRTSQIAIFEEAIHGWLDQNLSVRRMLELHMSNHIQPDADFDLAAYCWQNRLLLIFAPAADDDRFKQQAERFAAEPQGLEERDLLILHVLGDDAGEAAQALRNHYSMKPNTFAVLLIGKDGYLKHRFDAPVMVDEVFALIDVMPMRMREMQENGE